MKAKKKKIESLPTFSKTAVTKLLDEKQRSKVLDMAKRLLGSQEEVEKLKAYAEYAVKRHNEDSKSSKNNEAASVWDGMLPIDVLCAAHSNKFVDKKLFEFDAVNHFLKVDDMNAAIEVVECMLLLWKNEDNRIASFDLAVIEPDLKAIESKFIADISKGKEDAKCHSQAKQEND